MVNTNRYILNFSLISSSDRRLTNSFDMPSKDPEVLEGIVKD